MKQRIAGAFEPARAALHADAAEFAGWLAAEFRQIAELEVHVIGHHQVEIAIMVVISKSRAGGPAAVAHSRLFADVGESAVAVVSVKRVLAEVGAKNVLEAVVVVVTDADSTGPSEGPQSCLLRDIRKCPITIIPIQSIRGSFRGSSEARAG